MPTKSAERLELTLQRVPFSASVDAKMRLLRGRTGITPNILARMGFCLSLEEPGEPVNPFESEDVGREINRPTLLGKYDSLFIAFLRTWVNEESLIDLCSPEKFNDLFVAHMNRGFELVSARMRDLQGVRHIINAPANLAD